MGSPSASFGRTGAITVRQDKTHVTNPVDSGGVHELKETGDSNLGVIAPLIGSPIPSPCLGSA